MDHCLFSCFWSVCPMILYLFSFDSIVFESVCEVFKARFRVFEWHSLFFFYLGKLMFMRDYAAVGSDLSVFGLFFVRVV